MATCVHCNQPVEENTAYCPNCGNKISENAKEKETCLHHFRRNLRHERKCWSIFAWVWVGIIALIFGVAFLSLLLTTLGGEAAMVGVIYFFTYSFCGCLFLPCAIVSFVLASKTKGYLAQMDTDIAPAVERCGSVGTIVLGALFGAVPVVLVFIILNFVHVKTHKGLLDEIAQDQKRL